MSPTATPSLCMEDENTNTIIKNIMFYSIMTTSMCGFYGINNLFEQPNTHYPTCTEMTLTNPIHYS